MLTVNDSIKQAYNQYTTQRKSYIQVGNNSFFIQNLDVSADAYYEGNVIGNAIAKIAKFDIETVNVNGIDEFELFDGIWTGNQYEYISLGTFKLFNEEGTDDFFSSITAYDKLINFNKEYDPSLTTYPTTIYGLLQNICSQAGVELENSSIPNGNQPLPSNLFVENETLKMILNAICQISGNFGIISKDKLKLLLKGTETVNLSKYQLSNPEYKRTTWKINQVVLGMKDVEGEYVLRQDYEDIEQNGVHKLVINDNPFVYRQDLREAYIDNLFNQVKGFGYIAFETTWEGLSYVELGDLLNLDGKESIVLRYSLKSPHGLNSTLSAPSIIDSVIDYVDNSNSIANRQRRTELWVNKELGEIKSEVVDVETTVENITTTTQTSTGKNNLHITDSLESNALEYHVEGKSEQETSVQGNNILGLPEGYSHTSGSLTVSVEDGIIIINGSTTGIVTFDIPIPKLKLSGDYVYSISGEGDNKNNISLTLYDVDKKAIGTYIVPPADSSKRNRYALSAVDNTVEYIHFYAGANYTFDNVKLYYMINEGTALLPFEKFVPNSPSPDYPSEIKAIPSIRNLLYTPYTENNKLTDTATKDDHHVTTDYKVYLESGKTYTFDCKTDGIFGTNKGTDTVECWLLLDKTTTTLIQIKTNPIKFTPTTSGEYYLRYDINKNNTSHSFWDFKIEESPIAHDYVPYGAWAKVKVTGKNLFNKDNANILTGYISQSNSTILTSSTDKMIYVPCKSNTTYTITKGLQTTASKNRFRIATTNELPKVGVNIYNFVSGGGDGTTITNLTITTDENSKYIVAFIYANDSAMTLNELLNTILIEESSNATEYEAYKEKEVLIDLNKPNLFDKDDYNLYNGYTNSSKVFVSSNNAYMVYVKCNPNTTYTISREVLESNFTVTSSVNVPTTGETATNRIVNNNATSITVTTGNNDNYLGVYVKYTGNSNYSLEEILDSVQIYEGYSPYYELSSIGDTKDTLEIIDGEVILTKNTFSFREDGTNIIKPEGSRLGIDIHKNIIKKASSGSSGIPLYCNMGTQTTSNNTYLKKDGASIDVTGVFHLYSSQIADKTEDEVKELLNITNLIAVVPLAEPQQITLPNTQIPLFEGVNYISLVDDLETTTSIKYYRNTPIAQDYVVQQQLDETNSNLSTTTDKTNQNASDISATNTNLNNNYYNKNQIDVMNTSTQEIVTQIKNQVETTTTATNLQISILQEQLTNGVTAVRTETGYTFDKDGLKIQKSGSEMSSQLDNDGLVVKRNETEVLTVRSSGVETENLTVRTHFIIGNNTRVENYKNGTGFFYIGGAN